MNLVTGDALYITLLIAEGTALLMLGEDELYLLADGWEGVDGSTKYFSFEKEISKGLMGYTSAIV